MAGVAEGQTYVVDTGPGAAQGGLSLTRNQYLAGQFTLDLGHEINGLEGWMIYPTLIGDLPVYVVLYGDDGGVPDLDNQLHSQLIQVPASGIPFAASWHGITGLEIPVYGGTPYWLAFEVPTDNFGSGAMPPTTLQELDLYAIDSTAGWLHVEHDGTNRNSRAPRAGLGNDARVRSRGTGMREQLEWGSPS